MTRKSNPIRHFPCTVPTPPPSPVVLSSLKVEVVVTRKSNPIRNFPCTVLQSPVVLSSLKVEVVVTRKSNPIRHFPCTVLQSPVVLSSLKSSLVLTTVSTLKPPVRFTCQYVSAPRTEKLKTPHPPPPLTSVLWLGGSQVPVRLRVLCCVSCVFGYGSCYCLLLSLLPVHRTFYLS